MKNRKKRQLSAGDASHSQSVITQDPSSNDILKKAKISKEKTSVINKATDDMELSQESVAMDSSPGVNFHTCQCDQCDQNQSLIESLRSEVRQLQVTVGLLTSRLNVLSATVGISTSLSTDDLPHTQVFGRPLGKV